MDQATYQTEKKNVLSPSFVKLKVDINIHIIYEKETENPESNYNKLKSEIKSEQLHL